MQRTVFDASYLVMGLGDVYLGAPVATPLDPRHRLVTTKYNPARTWTAENSVGIGGAYCASTAWKGPAAISSSAARCRCGTAIATVAAFDGKPWLLRFFDQIRFYPVGAEELLRIRRGFSARPLSDLSIEHSELNLADYQAFLAREARRHRRVPRAASRPHSMPSANAGSRVARRISTAKKLAPGRRPRTRRWTAARHAVESHIAGNLWQVQVEAGQRVAAGDVLVILESMKMEIPLLAPCAGVVREYVVQPGSPVRAGQRVVVLELD